MHYHNQVGNWQNFILKKPIFDIPGYPSVLAGELVDNLMEQIKQFEPGFTFGRNCNYS